MSNENKPLSAEEISEEIRLFFLNFRDGESDPTYPTRIIAQQTAALRVELESVMKERDDWKAAADLLQVKRSDALKQRNEVVKLLEEYGEDKMWTPGYKQEWSQRRIDTLSRISSGETKPESKPNLTNRDESGVSLQNFYDSNNEPPLNHPAFPNSSSNIPITFPGKWHQPLFNLLSNNHGIFLTTSEMDDIIRTVNTMSPTPMSETSPWISVEDRLPENEQEILFTHSIIENFKGKRSIDIILGKFRNNYWPLFFDWRRSYEPTHWMPLPTPPDSLTDKK